MLSQLLLRPAVIVFAILALAPPRTASSATIEILPAIEGVVSPIKIEGKIEQGDAVRFLNTYRNAFNSSGNPRSVILLSKGGNVDEAIRIGRLIRKLRLETIVPMKIGNYPPLIDNRAKPKDDSNLVCASACFLIFAGGVGRSGNLIALHRPYLPAAEAEKIPDTEREVLQKSVMEKVRNYLNEMEIPQFYIDMVMSHSSQDSYLLKYDEENKYGLSKDAPSIEEILLSKCSTLTPQESAIEGSLARKAVKTPEEEYLLKQILDKYSQFSTCRRIELDKLQLLAWEREISQGRWLTDNKTGCQVWAEPTPYNESVSWDGQCKEDRANGAGTLLTYREGKLEVSYTGHLIGGKKNGFGITNHIALGITFGEVRQEGEYLDGELNGHGKQISSLLGSFEGNFRDGRRDGHGVEISADGTRYDGEWRDGQKSSHGVELTSDGTRYEGGWHDGKKLGHGVIITPTGLRYDGEWRDDQPDGQGEVSNSAGVRFEGLWKGGKPIAGFITKPDGSRYRALGEEVMNALTGHK